MFFACIFEAFTQAIGIWHCYMCLFLLEEGMAFFCWLSLLLFTGCAWELFFIFILFKVYMGYLHFSNTFCGCSFSRNCRLEETALALWLSVLTTLHFAEMVWWLSTVDIDQCEWATYTLWWLRYHQVVARPVRLGMAKSPLIYIFHSGLKALIN